jgi:MoxR-vWA-beta-propeller ternary system domain bpX3
MKLKIKPSDKNIFPQHGILIKNKEVKHWLLQLQAIHIELDTIPVYAIPDNTANSVWGCFVAIDKSNAINHQLQHIQFCQSIQNKLFIPEYSDISPKLKSTEIDKLFSKNQHILHPEFGLFELEHPINWEELLEIGIATDYKITTPTVTPFYPQTIRKIEVKALPPEELLKNLEDNIFPKKESFKDEALNWKEKIKLVSKSNIYY